VRKSFLQHSDLFTIHSDNPLKLCSKSAFKKKSKNLYNTHSTDYSEKSVGKIKIFSKNVIILRNTYIVH